MSILSNNDVSPLSDSKNCEKNDKIEKHDESKTDSVLSHPPTPTKTLKSSSKMSVRRSLYGTASGNLTATMLTFQEVKGRKDLARVQLLICNISDREIFVKLKCNANSNVTALPASSGHIAPKSQMRIMLNWKIPPGESNWKSVPKPKMLLSTYFLQQETEKADGAPTNTRLMAKVNTHKRCDPDNPPIEQLLLDAVGKDATQQSTTQMHTSPTSNVMASTLNEENSEVHNDEFKWIIYLLVTLVIILLIGR